MRKGHPREEKQGIIEPVEKVTRRAGLRSYGTPFLGFFNSLIIYHFIPIKAANLPVLPFSLRCEKKVRG